MTITNNQNSKIVKLFVGVFDYGAKQKATGHRIVEAVVSNRYEQKNPDGSMKLKADGTPDWGYSNKLTGLMILPESLASKFTWKGGETKTGKKYVSTRALFYGEIGVDKREQNNNNVTFWLNPVFRKRVGIKEDGTPKWEDCSQDDPQGQLMVFPLERREAAAAPKAAPAPVKVVQPIAAQMIVPVQATPAAAVQAVAKQAATKKVAKTTKVVASSEIPF